MTHAFQAINLVGLPKLSAAEAEALAAALVARAEDSGPLAPAVARALARMRGALDKVRAHGQSDAPAGDSTVTAHEADRDLDAAWAAAFAWCSGWTKLPYESSSVSKADQVYRLLFSEGLKFIQYRYKVEWIESQARMEVIDAQGLEAHFAALGGTEILETLRRAHERYGQALGITGPRTAPAGAMAENLARLVAETRQYVLQVLASADPDDSATQEAADRLLEPLIAMT